MTMQKTSEQWLDTRDEREEKLLEEIEDQLWPKTSVQWLDNTHDEEREENLIEEIENQLRREVEDRLRPELEDQLTEQIEEWIDHTRADREQRIRDLPELIERKLGITGPDLDE